MVHIDDNVRRLQSIIGYVNTAAVFFALGVFFCGYFVYVARKRSEAVFYVICTLINFTALILTLSRMGIFCFLLSIAVMIMLWRNETIKYFAAAAATVEIGAVLLLYGF